MDHIHFLNTKQYPAEKENIFFTSLETLLIHKLKKNLGINIPGSMLHNTACIFNMFHVEKQLDFASVRILLLHTSYDV